MGAVLEFMKLTAFGIPYYKYFIALLIIIAALLLAKVLFNAAKKIVSASFMKANIHVGDDNIQLLSTPFKLVFFVIGVRVAVLFLGLPAEIRNIVSAVLRTIIALLLLWVIFRFMDALLSYLQKRAVPSTAKLDVKLLPFTFKGIKVLLAIVFIILIIQNWNYDITTLLTGLGLGGLAFALAAQNTLANFFGSVVIMTDRPFSLGDWIQTPSVEGTVEDIGFRSTRIRTFSQALVTVPNSTLSNESITNWSRMGKRRISFRLKLMIKTSSDQVRKFIERARILLQNNPDLDKETVFVYLDEFGNESLDVFFYFFTKTTNWKEYLEIKEQVNFQIMDLLDELNISLAYQSRSVYLEKKAD